MITDSCYTAIVKGERVKIQEGYQVEISVFDDMHAVLCLWTSGAVNAVCRDGQAKSF